jgi:hypothetical protein
MRLSVLRESVTGTASIAAGVNNNLFGGVNEGTPLSQRNQCDGCRRGLKIVQGNHVEKDGRIYMGCTKERYGKKEKEEKVEEAIGTPSKPKFPSWPKRPRKEQDKVWATEKTGVKKQWYHKYAKEPHHPYGEQGL